HHEGKTAAFSGPGHLHLMNPVLATPSAWRLGHQFAAILEKVQMPPVPFDRVVHSTQSFTDRTLKMFPWNVFESQFQALRFSLKAALGHSPLLAQSQCCGKKIFQCHPFLLKSIHPKVKSIPILSPEQRPKVFALDSRSEKRAQSCLTQNTVTPSQRLAKPDQERNEINGR